MKALYTLLCFLCLLLTAPGGTAPPADGAVPERVNIVSNVILGVRGESLAESECAELGELLPEGTGLVVTCVVAGSPAEKAGLRGGDILLSLGSYPLRSPLDLLLSLRDLRPGDAVQVEYLRDGKRQGCTATLAAREQPVVVATAHLRPEGMPDLMAIQVHQADLARLLAAPRVELARLHRRFDALEQLTGRRAGEILLIEYSLDWDSLLVTREGGRILLSLYADSQRHSEALAAEGDSLSQPLREFLAEIVRQRRRAKGLTGNLEWSLTTSEYAPTLHNAKTVAEGIPSDEAAE